MFLYFALALWPLVLSLFINVNRSDREKKKYIILVFCVLAFFICFRGANVGTDTESYIRTYNNVKNFGFSGFESDHSIEYGYFGVVYLFSRLFSSAQSVIVFFTGITYAIIAYTIYHYSENVVMSSFLFVVWVLPSTTNGMRQHFAFALVLLAFHYLVNNKTIRSAILLIISVSFHNSALLFLPFIIVHYVLKRWSGKKATVLLSLGFMISCFFITNVMQLFLDLFPRYAHYAQSTYYDYTAEWDILWIVIYSIIALLFFRIMCLKPHQDEIAITQKEEFNVYFFLLLLLHVVVLILKSTTRGIIQRFSVYTGYAVLLVLPYIFSNAQWLTKLRIKGISPNLVRLLFYVAFLVWDVLMLQQNPHFIIPYTFCF